MKKLKVYWQGKPIGLLESPQIDMFELYGEWKPNDSEHQINFVNSLEENDEPELEVDSLENNSVLKCYLISIEDGEISLKIHPDLSNQE